MEKKRVAQFRHEYAANINSQKRLAELYQSLYEIDCAMDVKSPKTSGIRYAPISNDARLANYVTKREKLLAEIKRIEKEGDRIAHVLELMPECDREVFEAVYQQKSTYAELAQKQNVHVDTLRFWVNKSIDNALKAIDEEFRL